MFGVPPTDWRRPFPRTGPPDLPPPHSGPPSRLARVLGVGPGGSGRPEGPAGWLVPRTIVGLAVWSLLLATILGVTVALGFAASQARISEKEQMALSRSRTPGESASPLPAPSPSPSPKDPLTELVASAGRSVVVVEDSDPSGTTTTGSGFVLQATPSDIWVITSYTLVRAAKTADRPVKVRLTNFQRLDGSIRSSDPDRDLAVVVVEGENLPSLNRLAPPLTQAGVPVYVLEATAGTGKVVGHRATVSQVTGDGLLLESSELAAGVGGPVLDADGSVVGVLPVRYIPKGQTTPGVWAVPAQLMCRRLVVCPASALNVQPSAAPSASPG
jgi:hypothetical protein